MSTVRLQVPLRPRARITGPVSGTLYPVDRQGYVRVDETDVAGLLLDGFGRALESTDTAGAVATGAAAVEYGDRRLHQTVLTIDTVLPAIAGGANLAVGKLLYTFPAGEIMVEAASMSLAITQTEGNITADTPDGGLGTVIGSGVVATLDGTATFENILTGQTFNDCDGTAEVKSAIPTGAVPLIIAAGAAHTVYFNVADGWAASGDAGALLTGTVTLHWRKLNG